MTRNEKILEAIEPGSQLGIEIGPLTNPIVTKDMGNIIYIDHANTDELRKWYQNDPTVNIKKIVDIDYIWGDSTIEEAVGTDNKFDYVIASHVIEHVPDLIGWFKEINSILKPHGIISLVIPDKTFTLDRLRRTTSGADLIGAYLCKLRKPSPRQIFDHFSLAVEANTRRIWAEECDDQGFRKMYTKSHAFNACRESIENNNYIDSHCWVFTPCSFFKNLELLIELDLFDFEVIKFIDTAVNSSEFFVTLRKIDELQDDNEKRNHQLKSLPVTPVPTQEDFPPDLIECAQRMEAQRRYILEITQSLSWRITAPLRKIYGITRNFFRTVY